MIWILYLKHDMASTDNWGILHTPVLINFKFFRDLNTLCSLSLLAIAFTRHVLETTVTSGSGQMPTPDSESSNCCSPILLSQKAMQNAWAWTYEKMLTHKHFVHEQSHKNTHSHYMEV